MDREGLNVDPNLRDGHRNRAGRVVRDLPPLVRHRYRVVAYDVPSQTSAFHCLAQSLGDRANGSCMDFRPPGIPLCRGILRPFVGRNPLCAAARRRAGARPSSRSEAGPDAASGSIPLSDDGTRRGRADLGDHRRPRRRARVVLRRRVRRCMEVCRQRRDVPPVSDSMPVQAIGALAVAPSKPSIVWAGTGEGWAIRDADLMGDGVYKSVDSGTTWQHMGLDETGRIGRIIVHPTNPNIVYVCALGRATGEQTEHGVYRTTDGGKTWKLVLTLGGNYGCSGLTLDEKNPKVLFAGMWHVIMHTWAMYSGTNDPKDGVYVTRDAGDTWKQVVDPGLPQPPIGKIDVAVAPSNSKRVYALIQTADQGSVWRSDDGGVKWKVVNYQRPLIGRAGYYIHLMVSPSQRGRDPARQQQLLPVEGRRQDIRRSAVGRRQPRHLVRPQERQPLRPDQRRRRAAHDGSRQDVPDGFAAHRADVSRRGRQPDSVLGLRQSTGQRHDARAEHGAGGRDGDARHRRGRRTRRRGGRGGANADTTNGVDEAAAERRRSSPRRGEARRFRRVRAGRGGRGGAARAPIHRADSTGGGGGGGGGGGFGGFSTWDHGLGGCESGFTLPDPTDPNIVWATCYGNEVTRYDHRDKRARSVSPWIHTLDSPPDKLKYRCHWTPPLAIDPFDHDTVYYGCQVVFKTSNGGQSWSVISPDLSTRDPKYVVSSGGIVEDNLGQFYGEVVFAIAPSEIQRGLIWAGTNDGKVWYTKDGAAAKLWVDVPPVSPRRHARVGHHPEDRAVALRSGDRVRRGRLSHDGQPQAVHLQDDRLRRDVDQRHRRSAGDASARLRHGGRREPEQARHALRRDGARVLLLARRRRALDELQRGTAAHRGVVDRRPEDVARRRRLDVRARRLHAARHRAVGERPADDRRRRRQRLALPAASGLSPGAQRPRRDHVPLGRRRRGRRASRFSTRPARSCARSSRRRAQDSIACSGIFATTRRASSRSARRRRTTRTSSRSRASTKPTRPITHWGIQGAQTAGPLALPGTYTARLPSTARRSRASRS